MRPAAWITLALIAGAGCTGAGNPFDPDARDDTTVDAANDPTGLVGSWRQLPSTEDSEPEPAYVEFVAGGTMIFTNSGGNTSTGTWSVDGELLTLTTPVDDGPERVETSKFAVAAENLMLDAYLPDGPVDGLVGTWVARFVVNGDGGTGTFVLAADGTGSQIVLEDGGEPFELALTWELIGADELAFDFVIEGGPDLGGSARALPGVALGGALFERVD